MQNITRYVVTGGAVAAIAAFTTVHAGSVSWSSASGGLWQDGMNWSGAAEPGSSDDVLFDLGSMYTVLFNASAAVNSLTVGEDEVVFDLDGHTLSLLSASSPFIATQMNAEGISSVAFRNGTLSVPNANSMINEFFAPGVYGTTFRLILDDASWTYDGDMITGVEFELTPQLDLHVVNGSQFSTQEMIIDGAGSIRVAGEGSSYSFTKLHHGVFAAAAATILVEDSAVMSGASIDAKNIEVSGAELVTTGGIRLTDSFEFTTPGNPSFVATDGAQVSSDTLAAVGYDDGFDVSFSPYVEISGPGTMVQTGPFSLGYNGLGVISDGARLETTMGALDDGASITVESGAVWENAGVIQTNSFFPSTLRVFGDGRISADSIQLLTSLTRADIRGDGVIEADIFTGSGHFTIWPSGLPANPNAMLTIIGDVVLNDNSDILLRIFDALASTSLSVEGTVHADGAIRVGFDSGYTPAVGDSFLLLSADMIDGSFDYILPTLPGMLEWSIMASNTEISATIIPTPGAGVTFSLLLAIGAAGRRRPAVV